MDEDEIDTLGKKLKEARSDFDEEYKPETEVDENLSTGARAGIELVGAVLGGGLIGYGIDYMAGTKPAFFIIFILLGVITGFYNVYKITNNLGTAVGYGRLQNGEKHAKKPQKEDKE